MRYTIMVIREVWSTDTVVAESDDVAETIIQNRYARRPLMDGTLKVQDDIRTYVISEEDRS